MKYKIFVFIFTVIFCLNLAAPAFAWSDTSLLVDNADLLTDSDKKVVLSKLEEISIKHGMDIVVVTTDSLDGASPMDYADDFYDYNGYADDGILLLVSMEYRDWWISTTGYGITAFTDAGLEYLSEQFLYYLSDDMYYDAFVTYAELCDDYITQANTGVPYNADNLPKEPFSFLHSIIISLVIGFVVAFIATAVMKSKLKSVYSKSGAYEYVKEDSMNLTQARDFFLYRHIQRTAKPKNTGSSTHRSSSGRSHGGGGGKF